MESAEENQFGEPDNRVEKVEDLLNRLKKGQWRLYLPTFQRSFVWDEDDIKDFFKSMADGHPIGTIILWKPQNDKIDPSAAPLALPETKDLDGGETYYIVDGQQRITSILLLASGWKIENRGIKRTPISYNPSKREGEFNVGAKKGADLHRGVMDRLDMDADERERLVSDLGRERYKAYIDVLNRILSYRLPMYVINTLRETPEILRRMADVFVKVNRAGQSISNVELLLSYAAGIFEPQLSRLVREQYDEIQRTYAQDLDIQPYIRFVFGPVLGLKQREIENTKNFKQAMDKLSKQRNLNEQVVIHGVVKEAYQYFKLCLDLVATLFGKAAIELLPSYLTLVPVAAYVRAREFRERGAVPKESVEAIKKWLLLVNFNGFYSASPSSRLQRDIESIKQIKDDHFPYETLLENIRELRPSALTIRKDSIVEGLSRDILRKPGRAFLLLLYIALGANGASDLGGKRIDALKMENLAKHHIFPWAVLKETYGISEDDPKGANGLGNITLINPETNSDIGDTEPEEYLDRYNRDELARHFIPTDKSLWSSDKYEDFTKERVNLLYGFMKTQYRDLVPD